MEQKELFVSAQSPFSRDLGYFIRISKSQWIMEFINRNFRINNTDFDVSNISLDNFQKIEAHLNCKIVVV